MVEGLVASSPNDIKQLPGTTAVVKTDAPNANKVGLVSGGGSGHEPAHAGYVGKGMLDAAVVGEVFTSPTPDQVFEAIKAVDSGAGVLLIIKTTLVMCLILKWQQNLQKQKELGWKR